MNLSPVIQECVLENHSFGKEEGESRSFLTHHKQAKLFSQLPVVSLFGFLQPCQVRFQIRLLGKRSSVNSGEHFVLLTASPVSPSQAGQLKGFDRLG